MNQEERDEICHQIEKVEKKMNENMEKKMNEYWDHMEKNMEELKKSIYEMFLHTLDERVHKGDNKMEGSHENVEKINIEFQNHDYSSRPYPHH
jgi:flagellar biosynthesis chaperone FliJ